MGEKKIKLVKFSIAIVVIILIGSAIYSVIYPYNQQSAYSKDNYTVPKNNKVSTNSTSNNITTTNNNTTKIDNPKSHISVSASSTHGHAGVNEITVYVYNDSNKDIGYIRVNLFEKDKNSKTIKSKWTNDSSVIKAKSRQEIKTYFDFSSSESTLEAELDEVNFK